jgi:hypothetical protein
MSVLKKRDFSDVGSPESLDENPPTSKVQVTGDSGHFIAVQSTKSIEETLLCMQKQLKKLDLLDSMRKDISDIKEGLKETRDITDSCADKIDKNSEKIVNLEINVRKLDYYRERVIQLETYSRRDNLLFDGVKSHANPERSSDCVEAIYKIMEDEMGIDNARQLKITRAHRTGPSFNGKPRSMIVRFHFYPDRQLVWSKRFCLKNTNIWLNEDFLLK